jgi:hypothetical protein
VLLVLGEHRAHSGFQLQLGERVGRLDRRRRGRAQPHRERLRLLHGRGGLLGSLLADDGIEDGGGGEEQVERGGVERAPPHAHVVEPVLEGVGERRHALHPEHRREALQRVRCAEDRVQRVRVRLAPLAGILEPEEISVERLDGLLCLGDELGERFLGGAFRHRTRIAQPRRLRLRRKNGRRLRHH